MSLGWSPAYLALWAAVAAAPEESFLGLYTAPVSVFEEEDDFFDDGGGGEGLRVTSVVENSPAQEAGFQAGDVLLRINGTAPRSPRHLDRLVAALPVGTELDMEALRGPEILRLAARTVPRLVPAAAPEIQAFVERRRAGTRRRGRRRRRSRQRSPAGRAGSSDPSLPEGSPCPEAGLKSGHVVVSIDGEAIHGGRTFSPSPASSNREPRPSSSSRMAVNGAGSP